MKYYYQASKKPKNKLLLSLIEEASNRLFYKLLDFNINDVSISEYNRRYFGDKINSHIKIFKNLQRYSYLLSWSLSTNKKPLKDVVFMDYGGGHGMLSLLAKELGIGTVIYTDIFEGSCADAKKIGEFLNIRADYYVNGDIDDVIGFVNEKSIPCDCVANFDVIEHIYDIDYFLRRIKLLSNGRLEVFFASGANSLNPRINRRLMEQHKEFEYKDRPYKFGRKPTDCVEALVKIRKKIIDEVSEQRISKEEIELLAKLTRGLLKEEIEYMTKRYINTGILPSELKHPTNTCDPFTGNWFEHLMNPFELKETLEDVGFIAKIYPGYYGKGKSTVKFILTFLINNLISYSGRYGLKIAPFYAIHAIKE